MWTSARKDYGDIEDQFRPGHADYTYWTKYGIRDYRGGGRSSARETAARVAAGAVARKVLDICWRAVTIRGALVQIGPHSDRSRALGLGRGRATIRSGRPDAGVVPRCGRAISTSVRKAGSSVGAVIEVVAERRAGRAWARRSTASSMPTSPRR